MPVRFDLLTPADWGDLTLAVLMIAAGLLALLVPLGRLGFAVRPWAMIVVWLPTGVLGLLSVAARAAAQPGLVAVLLSMNLAYIAVLLVVFFWRRNRAAAAPPSSFEPAQFTDRSMLERETRMALGRKGDRIAAIRRVRELTGLRLKEAKDYVDGLARE